MSRSIAIGAAVVCALCGTSTGLAQFSGGAGDSRVTFGSFGGREDAQRELARAEHRLRAAERVWHEEKRKLDDLSARHASIGHELASIERKIAECRNSGNERELHRLQEHLAGAQREARNLEADLGRFRNLAAGAARAAEAARAEYFRQAECSPALLDAKQRIDFARHDLEESRRFAIDRLHTSFEWGKAAGWRDDVSARLAEAERCRAPHYEIDRLRRDLSEADARLAALEREALACDSRVLDAESRLVASQRAHDDLWARLERDLERDPAYCSALADQRRFEQDAARADAALCDTRELIARLEQDIDRLHGSHYISETRDLEHTAGQLRFSLDGVSRDLHAAEACFRRADAELRDARRCYDIALSACRQPIHDRRDDRGGHDRGGYDRDDGRREHDRRGDDRRHIDERKREDERKQVEERRREDDRRQVEERRREDDRRQVEERKGYDDKGGYRDRGDRYERARGGDPRQRTRDD